MDQIAKSFQTDRVVRCMPNTPAVVMEAMSVWTSKIDTPPEIKKKVKALFGVMGDELYVQDEDYIDMATAISGSGPAVSWLMCTCARMHVHVLLC
jgi:pyrroline-5-carboxylate reductase